MIEQKSVTEFSVDSKKLPKKEWYHESEETKSFGISDDIPKNIFNNIVQDQKRRVTFESHKKIKNL